MNLIDILLEIDEDKIKYENEYMKVLKVFSEIPSSGKKNVKRVQLVVWKSKNTDIPDVDIRHFNKESLNYGKGVTFSINDARELFYTLRDFFNEYDND